MAGKNYIENVAIVGGSGQVGSYFVDELLKTGKHKVTAITRESGTSTFPNGVHVAKVNYDESSSLVNALKGQDVLIITMSVMAPPDSQYKLIDAAGEAGVPFILPNWYGSDFSNQKLGSDVHLGAAFEKVRSHIESVGKSSWIALCCSFWYEYSLCGSPWRYGFDIKNRKVTFYDDGATKINTSTFGQTGRGAAKVLSLKISPESADDKSLTLSQFRNAGVFVTSFYVSQKDMFESLKRVTGTTDSDWEIASQPSAERYQEGIKIMQGGNRFEGFSKMLYSRVFFPNGDGTFQSKVNNEKLGLPVEDIDEATKRGIEMYS